MIKIVLTGGTIDDLEYDNEGNAPKNHQSSIREAIQQSRITEEYNIKQLMLKDSKFITDDDREKIASEIESSVEQKIIVVHGTMTMTKTAEFLKSKNPDKCIVLVGAAVPFVKPKSDALFNLGTAFGAVQTKENGVYVAMNGQVFEAGKVKKNMKTGCFEPTSHTH